MCSTASDLNKEKEEQTNMSQRIGLVLGIAYTPFSFIGFCTEIIDIHTCEKPRISEMFINLTKYQELHLQKSLMKVTMFLRCLMQVFLAKFL